MRSFKGGTIKSSIMQKTQSQGFLHTDGAIILSNFGQMQIYHKLKET